MTKGRRGRGEGTISQRADGRWEAKVSDGYRNGKRSRKCLYGKTKREVAEKMRSVHSAQDRGQAIGQRSQTLEQFLAWWLHDVKKGSVRSTTWNGYERKVRLHINPELGGVRLEKLTTQRIQSFLTMKRESGCAAAMVRSLRVLFIAGLNKAHELGLVQKNVAKFSSTPKVQRTQVDPLSVDELNRFFQAAADESLEAMFVLTGTAGLRRSEVLGLPWNYVDLEKGEIQVRQSLQRGPQIAQTKSGRGRNIKLTSVALEALKRHKTRQLEQQLSAGGEWSNKLNLVFTDTSGGPLEETTPNRIMTAVLKRANIRHRTFHELRHTVGTQMMGWGVNPKVVAELLGHSNVNITLDLYSHVSPTMQAEAVSRMEKALGEGR